MKAKLFLLLLVVLIQVIHTQDDLIKQVVGRILDTVPDLRRELEEAKAETNKTAIIRVIGQGLTSFKQNSEVMHYEGVHDDNLEAFLQHIRKIVKVPEVYSDDFVDSLMLIQFATFNEIVIKRFIYSIDKTGFCRYVCILGQRDEETQETEWLIADIKGSFELAPDLIIIESSTSAAWGLFKDYRQEVIRIPKTLNEEQITMLVKFFEILAFERFGEVLKISGSHHKLLFLE
jgi:hypothetical protein